MKTSKRIILEELEEQGHPEFVEDVIFWALEYYAENKPEQTMGKAIAYYLKERILEEEKNDRPLHPKKS